MYPELLAPLLIVVAIFAVAIGYVLLFRPVSRRLAARQLARRPSEAALAIIGAALGTAVIVGALIVGDTLNFSVRQTAYQTLGQVDERVIYADRAAAARGPQLLSALQSDPDVDGVLTGRVDEAAGLVDSRSGKLAEPRVLAWDLDFTQAAAFGARGGASGLAGPAPAPGSVVVNAPLASSLELRAGSRLTIYLYGVPHRYVVSRVVAEQGLAGIGFGATVNRNAFLPTGSLTVAAAAARTQPRTVTLVSNRGGVESGATLTTPVTARMHRLLAGIPATVDTPKRTVLDAAKQTGDALGALFLMIGSFSIIAGALLLVNIFTMLAEERKSQLGMLRAVGMSRSRLVESFSLEGAGYVVAAIVPGVLLGLGVGWAVALASAQIFGSWSADGNGLSIKYAVSPTSILNGIALGLVIALTTIVAASIRISRFNVIAAIRDLPSSPTARLRRITLVASTGLAILFALAAVPTVAASQAEATLLLPSLAAALLIPALRRRTSGRVAVTAVAGWVLVWAMVSDVVRPRMYDNPSMAVYVIQGTLVAFAGVALISQNQSALIRPVRRLLEHPSESALAVRLAVAYPLAKRFRTGATLVMYTLITLVLVLLVEITGVIGKSIDTNVAHATAGYGLRVDVSDADGTTTLHGLTSGPFGRDITGETLITMAPALATDPGHRTTALVRATAVGVPGDSMAAMTFNSRLPELATDRAVWELMARDPRYVALDQFFNQTGGPNGHFYSPGDTMTVTDPSTGHRQKRIIAGILSSALMFYPATGNSTNTYPIVSSAEAVRAAFPKTATVTTALLHVRPGVDPVRLAKAMQGRYLSSSLVATPIASSTRRMFAANIAFFRLMQAFLALGLVIGITGLGVVMVRAVRERRRTIGVLRALGFQARTVQRSFLAESAFVAAEGVLLGAALGVVTTWLMYQKSAAFDGVRTGYPIEWLTIGALALITLLASVIATIGPARRAAKVLPALAVRVAD